MPAERQASGSRRSAPRAPEADRLFDRLNVRIMDAVRADPSMPARAIARLLGVAQSTVRLRLQALARSRALRTIAVVNARQAGYQIFAVLGIQTNSQRVN